MLTACCWEKEGEGGEGEGEKRGRKERGRRGGGGGGGGRRGGEEEEEEEEGGSSPSFPWCFMLQLLIKRHEEYAWGILHSDVDTNYFEPPNYFKHSHFLSFLPPPWFLVVLVLNLLDRVAIKQPVKHWGEGGRGGGE